jgi:uncharacterized protein YdbL (DUF1318 family)
MYRKPAAISVGTSALRMWVLAAAVMVPAAARAAVDLAADSATVDDAKGHGIVGEQADGMIGVVRGDPDAGIMGALSELNMLRMESYRKAAGSAGDTVYAEARKAGQRLISEVPAGQFYKLAGGTWTKK